MASSVQMLSNRDVQVAQRFGHALEEQCNAVLAQSETHLFPGVMRDGGCLRDIHTRLALLHLRLEFCQPRPRLVQRLGLCIQRRTALLRGSRGRCRRGALCLYGLERRHALDLKQCSQSAHVRRVPCRVQGNSPAGVLRFM